jgi:predicted lipoprotein with Yx(FWY)xxD motif
VRRSAAARLLFAVGLAVAPGGCGSGVNGSSGGGTAEIPSSHALLYLGKVSGLGVVLIDSGNKTLYRFDKDVHGSRKTSCYGACARVWRPTVSNGTPAGESRAFQPEQLGTIERKDGSRQATYFGWPLYTHAGEGPRESQGAGMKSFGGTWYALRVRGGSVP